MKKIVYALGISFAIISCAEEKKAPEFTILKGTIVNATTDTITVRGGDFTEKIALLEDGSFTDTLTLPEEGYYKLMVNHEYTNLYLSPGKTHEVSLNSKKFDESIKYTGENAAANNYLAQKILLSAKATIHPQSMRSMPEDSLILLANENKQKFLDLLNETKGLDTTFIQMEKKAIGFNDRLTRETYALYSANGYYKTEGDAPSTAKILLQEIDLDDAENYATFADYKQLVSLDFYKETSVLHPEDSSSYTEKAFNYIDEVKSENIKNALLQQVAYRLRPGSEHAEELYTSLMKASTDEKFKDALTKKYVIIKNLKKGNPSPTFTYENHAGGETSLESLQGKYVYIDVWATWCGPCLAQLPALKKVEEEYKGKNIQFVSISIDTDKAHLKWEKMVTEKELGGIQLIADNAWNSAFVKNYAISGIPRFILIDPKGNIVSANAPRPSDPKLVELFESLSI